MTSDLTSAHVVRELARQADDYFRDGDFGRAKGAYDRLYQYDPSSFFVFARHIETTIRSSDPAAADQVLVRQGFPANDDEFFWGCQVLIEAHRFELAAELINRERTRGVISAPILAAGRARLFASGGSLSQARAVIAPFLTEDRTPVTIFRIAYFLEQDLGNLDDAIALSKHTALLWGQLPDCRFAFELMTFLTDFVSTQDFIEEFMSAFPQTKAEVDPWRLENLRRLELLGNAIDAIGPPRYNDRHNLKTALISADIPPNMILWAKHTLVLLVRSESFTQADFELFGEYLPNWEDGRFKSYILYAARRRFADWLRIQEQWLRWLIARAAYGDAAEWLLEILPNTTSDDIAYFALILLRISRAGIAPEFLAAPTEEAMLAALRAALPRTSLGLRAVLFEHIEALGLSPGNWHPAMGASPSGGVADAPAFRRLLGMSTGRLIRVSRREAALATTSGSTTPIDGKGPRPIFVISGQLRGFEATWPSLYRHVVSPLGTDVLMTVWDKTTNATGRHARRLERTLPDDVVKQLRPEQRFTDVFEREFPKTSSLLFGESDVSVPEVAGIMAEHGVTPAAIETENDEALMHLLRPTIQNGMIRMYYRFARAERLVREHELRTGIAFSHVIWSRPDYEILQLPPDALRECMQYGDVAFSSWVTEISVGDYFMVLPRLAFAAICSVFSRVVVGGDVTFLPWRPKREPELSGPAWPSAFGGPETIYEVLLASGFIPLGRVRGMIGRLLGRTPPSDVVRDSFQAEIQQQAGRQPKAAHRRECHR